MTLRLAFKLSLRSPLVALHAAILLGPQIAMAQQASDPSAETSAESSPQMRFRRARDAAKQEKWEEARRGLFELWNEQRTYEVAKLLVTVEFNLEHHASAGNFLLYVLANLPPEESPQNIEGFRRDVEKLKETTATASITSPPDAKVTVDGAPVDTSKQPLEVFLAIGTHSIKGQLGDQVVEERVFATGGNNYPVELRFKPVAAPAPAPKAPEGSSAPTPARDNEDGKSPISLYVGFALTGVALAAGTGFALSADSKQDDYLALRDKTGSRGCPTGTASRTDCDAAQEAADTRDTHATIANVGFVVGALVGAATLTYLFWPESSDAAKPAVRASAAVGPGGGGIALSHDF